MRATTIATVAVVVLALLIVAKSKTVVCRQNISDGWLGNLRECLAHLV